MMKLKSVYESFAPDDGERVLIERLWPLEIDVYYHKIDRWLKDIAPSYELIESLRENKNDWDGFKKSYIKELADQQMQAILRDLKDRSLESTVSMLYASSASERSFAMVVYEYLSHMT